MNDQIRFYEEKLQYQTDAYDLFAALNAGAGIIVIDARSPQAYETEHIPSALNIPHRTMADATTAHLDRGCSYVVYCDGIGCNASTRGALKMAQLGFTVRELLGGLEWWKRDGYATAGSNAVTGKSLICGC